MMKICLVSLCMPNDNFIAYIKNLENLFAKNIEEYILQKSIINKLVRIFKQIYFIHPCQNFP